MSVSDLQRKVGGGGGKVKRVITVRSQEELAKLKQELGTSTIYRAVPKERGRGRPSTSDRGGANPFYLQVHDHNVRSSLVNFSAIQ